jgi:uncharacterized protein with GYD domain
LAQYLYQASYTAESLATQLRNPEDRLAKVSAQLEHTVGAKIIAGGFAFGEYDICVIMEAADDEIAAAVALAIAAGGAVRSAKTTKLLTGDQWVTALRTASRAGYTPAKQGK